MQRWEDEPEVDEPEVEWDAKSEVWRPALPEVTSREGDPYINKAEQLREIRYVWKMTDRGFTQRRIAEAMGRSPGWVNKRLRQGLELYRPPALEHQRIAAIRRAEEEYQLVVEALETQTMDLDKAMVALDRIERRKAELLGTKAAIKYQDVSEKHRSEPVPDEIQKIIDNEKERRRAKEAQWRDEGEDDD